MDETEVQRTEQCYVTSFNMSTRTFFAQFCKLTNADLIEMNKLVNDYCKKAKSQKADDDAKKSDRKKKLAKKDIVCARYSADGDWYRAIVLTVDKEENLCHVLFVDYGNIETVSFDDLVKVDRTELAVMGRAPFGISCRFKDSDNFDQEEMARFRECLEGNYVMIKVLERQTSLQWKVDIPMHAYNNAFWRCFKPGKESGHEKSGDGV